MQGAAIQLEQKIVGEWKRSPDSVFVFPSELVAESWARRIARSGKVGTVVLSRFLSWDSFKEGVFPGSEDAKPANSLIRALFAEQYLAANAKKSPDKKLKRWLFPDFAADYQPFVEALTRILPGLGMVIELFDTAGGRSGLEAGNPQLWGDFRDIHREYTSFLRRYHYYEPLELGRREPKLTSEVFIFLPEVLEDWPRFGSAFEGRPGVHLVSAAELANRHQGAEDGASTAAPTSAAPTGSAQGPSPAPTASTEAAGSPRGIPAFYWYEHFIDELDAAFTQIQQLVADGTHPSDIAITLGSWDNLWPYLEREAAKRGVPLVPRRGEPLSKFASAALVSRLRSLAGKGFGFELLSDIVLDARVPWKPELAGPLRALYYHGLEKNWALASLDDWTRIARGRHTRGAEALKLLRRCGEDLQRADSFRKLQVALERVFSSLIGGTWAPADEAALQRSRVLLSNLAAVEDELDLRVPDPAGFWLSRLESSIYVPQTSAVGIEVFPFRVSAGHSTQNHFVLGLDDEAARIYPSALGFLREDQRGQIRTEFGMQVELGPAFLEAYAAFSQGASFSGSQQGATGAAMPPARTGEFFDLRVADIPHPVAGLAEIGKLSGSAIAAAGAEWYETFASEGLLSLPGTWNPRVLVDRLVRRDSGALQLSYAQMSLHQTNPLDYVLKYGLRLEPRELAPATLPPDVEGMAIHAVLASWMREIQKRSEGWILHRELETWGGEFVEAASRREIEAALPPLPARLSAPGFALAMRDLAEAVAAILDGMQVVGVEADGRVGASAADLMSGVQVALGGRIDLVVAGRDGGLQIVDFKRSAGRFPSLKRTWELLQQYSSGSGREALLADDEDDGSDSEEGTNADEKAGIGAILQFPIYRFLVEGRDVASATSAAAGGSAPEKSSSDKGAHVARMSYIFARVRDEKKREFRWYDEFASGEEKKRPFAGSEDAKLDSLVSNSVQALVSDIARGEFRASEDWSVPPLFRAVSRERFILRFEKAVNARGVENPKPQRGSTEAGE